MEITTTIGRILHRKGSEVFSVSSDDSVFDAISIMAKHNIGALPVMKGAQLVGMVSERDYARKIALLGRVSKETVVSEIMTADVVTVTPEDSVQECLKRMTDRRIRHLPVLQANQIVGIISIGDLVNWVIRAQQAIIKDLENYVIGAEPV